MQAARAAGDPEPPTPAELAADSVCVRFLNYPEVHPNIDQARHIRYIRRIRYIRYIRYIRHMRHMRHIRPIRPIRYIPDVTPQHRAGQSAALLGLARR